MLTFENTQVPILDSMGRTLKREPTHICEKDPAELVCNFMEELEWCGKKILGRVRVEFMPCDVRLPLKAQHIKIKEWCNQVPDLGFNSGR